MCINVLTQSARPRHHPRVTTVIDPAVWATVRGRRGPARWVVVVAVVVSLLLVGAAWGVVARGLTAPQLWSDGWSSQWTESASTGQVTLRLGNSSERDVRVESARLTEDDGSPLHYAEIVALTPTTVPGRPDAGASWDVPLTVRIDCDAARAVTTGTPALLVLTTSGTWPHHDQVLTSDFDVTGWCTAPEG